MTCDLLSETRWYYNHDMMPTTILALMLAQAPVYPPPFPREGATKLIENERVVVWEVEWTKGRPTPMHEHRLEVVGVNLADGAVKQTFPDGTSRLSERSPVGEASFGARGIIHREEGISDALRRAVLVELKDSPSPPVEVKPTVPLAFPREGAKRLIENARVSVWDYTWTPGKPVPLHFHDKDVVVVFVEAGKLRSTPPGGEAQVTARRFGEVSFNPRNRTHSEEAVEGTPRAIIIELK